MSVVLTQVVGGVGREQLDEPAARAMEHHPHLARVHAELPGDGLAAFLLERAQGEDGGLALGQL